MDVEKNLFKIKFLCVLCVNNFIIVKFVNKLKIISTHF